MKTRLKFSFVFMVCFAAVALSGCLLNHIEEEYIQLGMSPHACGDESVWTDTDIEDTYIKMADGGVDVVIYRHHWADDEPSLGEYALTTLDYEIGKARRHGMKFALIYNIIDSSSLGVYPDGIDPSGSFDSAVFYENFLLLVNQLLVLYRDDIDYFFIGNEVNQYLFNNRGLINPFLMFCGIVREYFRLNAPEIPVGVVCSYHEARSDGALSMVADIAEFCDVLGFTVYMQYDSSRPTLENTCSYFKEMIQYFDGVPLAVIETAWSSAGVGGSIMGQIDYIYRLELVLRRYRRYFMFFSWFNLHDFSPSMSVLMAIKYDHPAYSEEDRREFYEFLSTLALIDNDCHEKPAWLAWKGIISPLSP
ncbi:MAG: hypothetical protein JW881_17930 [Spirochaetales bacterium]|nr:hypothetical protein [Spirochaetales bacterium]